MYTERFKQLIETTQEKLDDDSELHLDLEEELGLEKEEGIDVDVWC